MFIIFLYIYESLLSLSRECWVCCPPVSCELWVCWNLLLFFLKVKHNVYYFFLYVYEPAILTRIVLNNTLKGSPYSNNTFAPKRAKTTAPLAQVSCSMTIVLLYVFALSIDSPFLRI